MNLHWRWFCGEWRKLYNVGEKNANWFKCFWFYKSSRLYLMSDWSTMWTSKEVETIHKMYNLLCVQKICMDPISYLFSRDLQVCDVQMGGIRHLDILKYKLNNIYLICKIWLSFSNIQNLQYLTLTAMYLIILVVVIQRSSWRTNRNLTLNTGMTTDPGVIKVRRSHFRSQSPFYKRNI